MTTIITNKAYLPCGGGTPFSFHFLTTKVKKYKYISDHMTLVS